MRGVERVGKREWGSSRRSRKNETREKDAIKHGLRDRRGRTEMGLMMRGKDRLRSGKAQMRISRAQGDEVRKGVTLLLDGEIDL